MACFTVPLAEAAVVTVAYAVMKSKENKVVLKRENGSSELSETATGFSRKLKWLMNLLFGGSFLLAFEHIWHGEVVPWYPFLTAAANPADKAEMLHEMATVGVLMAVTVTAVWGIMVAISAAMEKKAGKNTAVKEN